MSNFRNFQVFPAMFSGQRHNLKMKVHIFDWKMKAHIFDVKFCTSFHNMFESRAWISGITYWLTISIRSTLSLWKLDGNSQYTFEYLIRTLSNKSILKWICTTRWLLYELFIDSYFSFFCLSMNVIIKTAVNGRTLKR